jgi:hypothetical protein
MKLPSATKMATTKTDVNFVMKRFQKMIANDEKYRSKLTCVAVE